MKPDLRIKIEGLSGSGKTILGRGIAAFLEKNGFEVSMEDDCTEGKPGTPVDLSKIKQDEIEALPTGLKIEIETYEA